MLFFSQEVLAISQEFTLSVSMLSKEDKNVTVQSLTKKFLTEDNWPIWAYLQDAVSVNNADSWKWVEEFVKDHEVILFSADKNNLELFSVHNCHDLTLILGEMRNTEFCLTNRKTEFLICFNHHDILLASGNAKEWLKKYKTKEFDWFLK